VITGGIRTGIEPSSCVQHLFLHSLVNDITGKLVDTLHDWSPTGRWCPWSVAPRSEFWWFLPLTYRWDGENHGRHV